MVFGVRDAFRQDMNKLLEKYEGPNPKVKFLDDNQILFAKPGSYNKREYTKIIQDWIASQGVTDASFSFKRNSFGFMSTRDISIVTARIDPESYVYLKLASNGI